jgi:hypothetical protein
VLEGKRYFFIIEVDPVEGINEPATLNFFPVLAFQLICRTVRKQFQLHIGG